MSTDWRNAEEYMMRNQDLNPPLLRERTALNKQQARDLKLAGALESGRIYGLRQQKFDMRLKRELDSRMQHPPVSKHW